MAMTKASSDSHDPKIPLANTEFWTLIEQIEDLSLDIGLERVSGQRESYKASLKLLIREIEKCDTKLKNFLAVEDMLNFSIEAHCMKSSLANMGAMALSEKARELETASAKADISFCAFNLPSFLNRLICLRLAVTNAFEADNTIKGPIDVPVDILQIFRELIDAIGESNYLKIEKMVKELDSFDFGSPLKEEIETIEDAVMMMDYESAVEMMRKLAPQPGGTGLS